MLRFGKVVSSGSVGTTRSFNLRSDHSYFKVFFLGASEVANTVLMNRTSFLLEIAVVSIMSGSTSLDINCRIEVLNRQSDFQFILKVEYLSGKIRFLLLKFCDSSVENLNLLLVAGDQFS